MNIFISILLFCIILFFYIHVYNHIKTSDYLEVYEIDSPSKEKLEELCELKQPLLIKNMNILDLNIDKKFLLENYGSFDLKIRSKEKNDIFLPIKLNKFLALIEKDVSGTYISENNNDFLIETTLQKNLQMNDELFRPYTIFYKDNDLIMGSVGSSTKLGYSIDSRNILYLESGSVEIMLCPPKNYKYLHVVNNYENLDFFSNINIDAIDDKFREDYDKIKFLKIILTPGNIFYIPPNWFYSVKILEPDTIVFRNKYRTFIGNVAILPQLFLKFLQSNNLKINFTKIIK